MAYTPVSKRLRAEMNVRMKLQDVLCEIGLYGVTWTEWAVTRDRSTDTSSLVRYGIIGDTREPDTTVLRVSQPPADCGAPSVDIITLAAVKRSEPWIVIQHHEVLVAALRAVWPELIDSQLSRNQLTV